MSPSCGTSEDPSEVGQGAGACHKPFLNDEPGDEVSSSPAVRVQAIHHSLHYSLPSQSWAFLNFAVTTFHPSVKLSGSGKGPEVEESLLQQPQGMMTGSTGVDPKFKASRLTSGKQTGARAKQPQPG